MWMKTFADDPPVFESAQMRSETNHPHCALSEFLTCRICGLVKWLGMLCYATWIVMARALWAWDKSRARTCWWLSDYSLLYSDFLSTMALSPARFDLNLKARPCPSYKQSLLPPLLASEIHSAPQEVLSVHSELFPQGGPTAQGPQPHTLFSEPYSGKNTFCPMAPI